MTFWHTFSDFCDLYLGPFDTLGGLVSIVFIIWTWLMVLNRRKRALRRIMKEPGAQPVALLIDWKSGVDTLVPMRNFIQTHEDLKKIPADRILTLTAQERIRPETVQVLVEDLRRKSAEIMHKAPDVIHLFYAGPVTMMAYVGAEFANGCLVKLYHHNQSNYEYWGPLRHDAI